jgi:hypothetical protein
MYPQYKEPAGCLWHGKYVCKVIFVVIWEGALMNSSFENIVPVSPVLERKK